MSYGEIIIPKIPGITNAAEDIRKEINKITLPPKINLPNIPTFGLSLINLPPAGALGFILSKLLIVLPSIKKELIPYETLGNIGNSSYLGNYYDPRIDSTPKAE